ncbi:Retrovirus-related Pol polyprotein from transposon RE2 [Cardamine amara subsp. amara]|uniref:Retrovirus-related Pol polyprotein from transposon RE2 n=1 Tax=Cardamine amara subsp. amara TaxID=228776 RepID=A0ABD1B220_CARAN
MEDALVDTPSVSPPVPEIIQPNVVTQLLDPDATPAASSSFPVVTLIPASVSADLTSSSADTSSPSSDSSVTPTSTIIPPQELGVGKRPKHPPAYLSDYVVGTVSLSSPSPLTTPSPQQSSGTVDHPLSDYLSSHRFSPGYCSYLIALTTAVEPRSFKEAMTYEEWKLAMKSEVTSLEDNHTWDLEELPPDKKVIGSQWVFRVKLNADGSLERYKARLVALGNHQVEGLNYTETFAPVAKMTTVRTILDVAAKRNYEVHQMDVHNAFLHGDLDEEIYMKPPPGFSLPGDTRVCRLRKSIYGLKQSPRCWFAKLADALLQYGFKQTRSDYSLFVFHRNGVSLQILVYVDDLMISGNSSSAIQELKDYLSTCFKMKDLGPAKYFLGLEIARSPEGFYVCQRKYSLDIVTETGLLGCKPAGSPIDQNHRLALADGPILPNPAEYRRLVGRLVYLASTRPDLSYAIHVLSQFMKQPRQDHWDVAMKVVRYLKGTIGQGILLRANSPLHVTGWCDSDYGSCPLTRKSLTGWFVQLGDSPISWKTKKQKTVSCSSAEAEYRAMAALCRELKWIKSLLFELGIDHTEPISLLCDSQAALHISSNPVFHERTKHIEIDCHFVRDYMLQGIVKAAHVRTTDQLADILTKALGRREFDAFLLKLGIQNLHAPT